MEFYATCIDWCISSWLEIAANKEKELNGLRLPEFSPCPILVIWIRWVFKSYYSLLLPTSFFPKGFFFFLLESSFISWLYFIRNSLVDIWLSSLCQPMLLLYMHCFNWSSLNDVLQRLNYLFNLLVPCGAFLGIVVFEESIHKADY